VPAVKLPAPHAQQLPPVPYAFLSHGMHSCPNRLYPSGHTQAPLAFITANPLHTHELRST
jgi:hypothetical protein